MPQDWQVEFKRAMINAIVENGSPVDPTPRPYGWVDYKNYAARRNAIDEFGIDYDKTELPEDASWYEFQGTFWEGDHVAYGAEANIVLMDSSTSRWRYTGTISDMIATILREEEDD